MVGGLGFGGGYNTAYIRLRHDKKYTVLNFAGDIVKETTSLKSADGVVAHSATAVAAAVSLTAAGAAMPAVLTFAGAVSILNLGKTLTETYLPRLYKKMTGKF